MRIYWLTILLAFGGSLPLADQAKDPASKIEWQSSRKLGWDDFKRAVPAASSDVGFVYDATWHCPSPKLEFSVKAYFDPSKSWVRPEMKSDEVLRHEQLHFDLAELYARTFRGEMSEFKVPCGRTTPTQDTINAETKSRIERLFDKRLKALFNEQNRYDSETANGRDITRQKEWEESVKKRLNVDFGRK